MITFNKKSKLMMIIFILVALLLSVFYYINIPLKNDSLIHDADLIIYTPLSKRLYHSIIKEYQERNDISIEVREESEENIINKLQTPSSFDGDLILGMHNDTTKENKDLFTYYATLNSIPFVVVFNNHLLTSRERLEDYNSLIESDLKGKIGFVDPNTSVVYQKILDVLSSSCDDPPLFKTLFIENTQDHYLETTEDINLALQKGTISVGITNIQSAMELSNKSANIKYLDQYKNDCIVNFDIAIPKNSKKTDLALNFFEFVQSNDVKQFMSSYLNMGIGGQSYGLD